MWTVSKCKRLNRSGKSMGNRWRHNQREYEFSDFSFFARAPSFELSQFMFILWICSRWLSVACGWVEEEREELRYFYIFFLSCSINPLEFISRYWQVNNKYTFTTWFRDISTTKKKKTKIYEIFHTSPLTFDFSNRSQISDFYILYFSLLD